MSSINDILSSFRDGHHEFENGKLTGFEGSNPYDLFEEWTKNAVDNNESEPNAFVLSTVDAHHQPSSRIVYLKDVIERKLVFYTNYSSHKGSDLLVNSQVSMLFFWPNSLRQVRVQGICSKVPAEISDAYFNSRPRGSQIGAWASNQSEQLDSRETLEKRVEEFEQKFTEKVPRPENWGGYWIEPTRFEFWQGRPSRLHDRIVFTSKNEEWSLERLNP